MTVPGKGGRPRKWRSDADRVRAFRARARGEDEPTTIELALESGDDAAVAWNQVRELGDTVNALTAELRATQAALRHAEKELEQAQVRASWLSEGNDRLRAALDAAERDRADVRARLAELVHTKVTDPKLVRTERNAGKPSASGIARRDGDNSLDHTRQAEGAIEPLVGVIERTSGSHRFRRWERSRE